MVNMIHKCREQIKERIWNAIVDSIKKGELPESDMQQIQEIIVETPREKGYGDFSTNVAMQLARQMKKAPRQIAETIIKNLDTADTYISDVSCAGAGFINFKLKTKWLEDSIKQIHLQDVDYGKIDLGKNKKVMVEYVSANPTGPLHMGNARGGALGDCIASVLEAAGYDVTREYYINDAGNQIEKFGASLEARYIQQIKGEDAIAFPEDGYKGEDIVDHVKEYIKEYGEALINLDSEQRRKALVEYALPKNIKSIREALKTYGINFDVWFSEQSLYDSGELQETLEILKKNGYVYEKEGALWFKATDFGVEKDEVLVRNNGVPTYYATDIAYHRNKFEKRKFDWVIDLWGADHHGHVARMKAAMTALGLDASKLDVVLFQLVRLFRNGEIARMSKRTGRAISLIDLLEDVGRDAARFFFNMKASGNHLDFDLDLAAKQSNENPVYYVQYAHARICSMIRILEESGVKVPSASEVDLSLLVQQEEIDLMRKLAELPDEIRICAQTLEPSRLTRYVLDVAGLFHSFYNACRVKGEEEPLMLARLVLADCTRIVIRNVLNILSISAPERM